MESNYIRKLKKGEQKALDYIVERFLPVVKGAVYKILYYGETADMAEECINDVFLSVWKNADKFQGETDLEFKKWIYKIAKFKAIDYYRKVCRSREITVSEQNMNQQRSAEDEFILLENKQELIAVMNQMDKSDREIMLMKFFLGMKSDEIAEKLGITRAAVDNRIYRGKKKLTLKISGLEAVSI